MGAGRVDSRAGGHRRRTFFWRRLALVGLLGGVGAGVGATGERALSAGRLHGAANGAIAADTACPRAGAGDGTVELAAARAPALTSYVVRPGDTLWAIAARFSHGGDPRPMVASLEAEVSGSVLQPGQRLSIP